MRRIGTALIGLPILWGLIKFTSPLVWFLLGLVVTCFASWELLSLLKMGGHRVYRGLGLVGCAASLIPFIDPRIDTALPVVATGALAIIASAILAKDFAEAVDGALCTVFSVAFVGLNLGYQIALRSMSYSAEAAGAIPATWTGAVPFEWRLTTSSAAALGQDLLCLLLFVVWSGDTAAFVFGKLYGRTPLAARVSPKKTVEGALAGIAASALAGWIAHIWFFHRLPAGHAIAIGILLGIAGIVGDLAESVVKRAAGAKDSSGLLPGHGGILDRVDSLLVAGPALYYYHRIFLMGRI